jgi:predicted DNA-binding transcriptional regulator AlpA
MEAQIEGSTAHEVTSCRLLSLKATATALGLSIDTVRDVMADPQQKFPEPVRVGRRKYLRLTDLQTWVASRSAA